MSWEIALYAELDDLYAAVPHGQLIILRADSAGGFDPVNARFVRYGASFPTWPEG